MECNLFHKEIAEGIYRLSDSLNGPNEDGFSDLPGQATQNSYLVVGKEKAALIDLAVDTPDLLSYAQNLAKVPVMVVLTHGHPDHVYHIDKAGEVWVHPEDNYLITRGMPGICEPVEGIKLNALYDEQIIDLGGRTLEVISLPGHTMGSVLLLDDKTKTLLVGDTCARRLLYGITPSVTLNEHIKRLEALGKRDFTQMYSAHDRCALPKEYLSTVIKCIKDLLPLSTDMVELPGIGSIRNLHWGNEDTLEYFDMAVRDQYLLPNGSLKLTHLRTLHMENPIGIDCIPEFSWRPESSEQDISQSAYRILVTSGDKLFWDSGICFSADEAFIQYGGKELDSCREYVWYLNVWDNLGNLAAGQGSFETAFMDKRAIRAKWIESDFKRHKSMHLPFWSLSAPVCFEKTVKLKDNVKSARLYSTAHGCYKVYVNGARPDEREFAPEHTVYDKVLYYQTYSLDALLHAGDNKLMFYVSDGWYFCPQTKQDIREFTGNPAVFFQLEVKYQNGEREIFFSDGSELCREGNITYSDIFLGEEQDYTLNKFETHKVSLASFSLDNLCAQNAPAVKAVRLLPATNVYKSPKGETIVDFGQVICGRARIHLNVKKGKTVSFEYFEVTDNKGNYLNTMLAPQKDVYVSDGEERDYEASFTFHGFRYIKVSGLDDVCAQDFTAVLLSSEKEGVGEFECSDERINRLVKNILYSQLNNTLSIPTDCPSREKGGFTGDIQIYAKAAMLNEDMTPFLTSWLKNLSAAQGANGAVPITVPETAPYKNLMVKNAKAFGDEWPVGVAGWSDAAVIVPYTMYMMTGNLLILQTQYESMKSWCDYIINTASSRIGDKNLPPEIDSRLWNTGFHFGEWLIPSKGKNLSHKDACENSAFYIAPIFGYISLSLMAKISEILEKSDADFYAEHAKKTKAAIQNALIYDGKMKTDNMGAYVLMIALDLVPEECKDSFAGTLVSLLEKNGGCLDTGFLATPFILDAFTKIGRRDLAISLLWQTKMPSWLYEVENGATTIWESWDAITPYSKPSITSYDHYAFGCVYTWIFENLVGLRALEAGFRKIEICPQPQGLPLTYCGGSYQCEYGKISVHWDRDILKVSVPCGVCASVRWKDKEYNIGSGEYSFS